MGVVEKIDPRRTTALPWHVDISHIGCDKGLEKSKPGLVPWGYAIRINLVRILNMSVNIEASALSMPESIDSLKVTPLVMHRIWVDIDNVNHWYAVMRELRTWFGKNWRGQPRVKRKITHNWSKETHRVWFDVPDPTCATWLGIKLGVQATLSANK